MSADFDQNLDELLDRAVRSRLAELGDELTGKLRAELAQLTGSAVEGALEQARGDAQVSGEAVVDGLAECSRRIRKAQAVTEIAAELVESAARFCGRAALFIHRSDRALGFRVAGAGVDENVQLELQKISLQLDETSAIAQVIREVQAREAHGDAEHLGAPVTALLGLSGEDRVWLLPVALRDKVLAVLYLDTRGEGGALEPIHAPAIEILVALTEAWIEAVGNRKKLAAG